MASNSRGRDYAGICGTAINDAPYRAIFGATKIRALVNFVMIRPHKRKARLERAKLVIVSACCRGAAWQRG